MKVVVIGGTGLIGSKLVLKLTAQGHDAVSASPASGVNSITSEGLADVLKGADVLVDVSNSPSLEAQPAMDYFTVSTRNLLNHAIDGGVNHYVALSVVGTERLQDSGYFRAKLAQEKLIKDSLLPYSIVRATQFFEFAKTIANSFTQGVEVRLPHVFIRPMAADDIAGAVGNVATGEPVKGTVEVTGPEMFRLDEFVRLGLEGLQDQRKIVIDSRARYFGALLDERTLIPEPDAEPGLTRFDAWLQANATTARGATAGRVVTRL